MRIEINANYYARAVGDCFRWLHTVWLKFCLLYLSSHFGILPGLCLHRALLWTTACAACSALDRRRRCLHCAGPPIALLALLWAAACAACTPRTSCLACCASHLQRQMFDAICWSHRAPPSPEQLDWRAFFTNHTFYCHRTRVLLPLVAIWWRPVATRVADFFITKLWIQMTLGIQWSSGHISDTQRTYFHRCLWNPSI